MKIERSTVVLRLREPFQISRSSANTERQVVLVRIGAGTGEAAPSSFEGETVESTHEALELYDEALADLGYDAPIDTVAQTMKDAAPGNAAARSAIESALWDNLGHRLNAPLWRIWGLDPTHMPPTSFTIGLDSIEEMTRKARQATAYSVLKVKLGRWHDIDIVKALRDVTDKPIRVDANTAWTPSVAIERCAQLLELGVEMVEQPVSADDYDGLAHVRNNTDMPIFADESVKTSADVVRLAGRVDGINIKFAKCGGPTEAITMIRLARLCRLKVMVGCMIESSVGIATMAHIAPLVDCVDLDGNLLVANDPYQGPRLKDGVIQLTDAPGHGARSRI